MILEAHRFFTPVVFVAWLVAGSACEKRSLRGDVAPSEDGQTYLTIDDDNGGHCGDLVVDGGVWPHRVGQLGRIKSGVHTIDCVPFEEFDPRTVIEFRIPKETVFRFDYWGP